MEECPPAFTCPSRTLFCCHADEGVNLSGHARAFIERGRADLITRSGFSEHGGLRSDLRGGLSEHDGLRSDLSGRLRSGRSDRLNGHGLRGRCGLSNSELRAGRSCKLREHGGDCSDLSGVLNKHDGLRSGRSDRLNGHGLRGRYGLGHSELRAGRTCEKGTHGRRVRCGLSLSERMRNGKRGRRHGLRRSGPTYSGCNAQRRVLQELRNIL